MLCLLCAHPAQSAELQTYDCEHCGLKFKDPASFITPAEEAIRYSHHNNDSSDEGYRKFLNKLVTPLQNFLPAGQFNHIDFGCGPEPTVSLLLQSSKVQSRNYDPQFYPDNDLLTKNFYDVLTSTEVVEHFRNPANDWNLMISLVKQNGIMAIMTQLLKDETKYTDWWYKNDPTHIVFYRKKTIDMICRIHNLDLLFCDQQSVMIFKKLGN